jgi:hypothetical protein
LHHFTQFRLLLSSAWALLFILHIFLPKTIARRPRAYFWVQSWNWANLRLTMQHKRQLWWSDFQQRLQEMLIVSKGERFLWALRRRRQHDIKNFEDEKGKP